jgi:hypothetical protein
LNKLFYNGQKYIELPSKWAELDRWQLSALIEHVHQQADIHDHRINTLLILAATRESVRHQGIIAGLTQEDRYDVAKFMTWWVYDNPIYFTHNPFQKYQGYYGPGKDLKFVYFEEFIKAEKYYTAYAKDHKPEDLDALISCLYRPKRWGRDAINPLNQEDCRILFSTKIQEMMLPKVAKWKSEMKLAIYYYFDSCLQLLVKTFPWAFEPGEKVSFRLRNDSPKTLYHIARELAKGIELEKVLMRPIIPVFFELNEARIDSEKMKLQIAKNNRTK